MGNGVTTTGLTNPIATQVLVLGWPRSKLAQNLVGIECEAKRGSLKGGDGSDRRGCAGAVRLVQPNQQDKPNKPNRRNRPNEQISVCDVRYLVLKYYRFRKDAHAVTLGCRKNHTGQEACTGRGLGFVHDSFEMLFDGVFA